MTEAEWMSCADPTPMLTSLYKSGGASYRKPRLFTCACCRLIPKFLDSQPDRENLLLAEAEADGQFAVDEDFSSDEVWDVRWYRQDEWDSADRAISCFRQHIWDTGRLLDNPHQKAARREGDRTLCNLLRDILGNPFRPVTVDPRWLTSTVVDLAAGIYAERAFDRMPILADALEEAGCDHADILTHCRGDGPHVRGCWVVDLVLGKS